MALPPALIVLVFLAADPSIPGRPAASTVGRCSIQDHPVINDFPTTVECDRAYTPPPHRNIVGWPHLGIGEVRPPPLVVFMGVRDSEGRPRVWKGVEGRVRCCTVRVCDLLTRLGNNSDVEATAD